MAHYDVFNGDADGLCALQQLRLREPIDAVLVTGIKRDIKLLGRIKAKATDVVTVLDISLEPNRPALEELLQAGVRVRYFDHHFAGHIPQHPLLVADIDCSPDVCTSLLVDRHLGGEFRSWAVVGAFGDNLNDSAQRAAQALNLDEQRLNVLQELGNYLNYNAYGASVDDLYFSPEEVFRRLHPYEDPLIFVQEDDTFAMLRARYADDFDQAGRLIPEYKTENAALFILPSEPWARRVSGVFANRLVHRAPQRAHALLTRLQAGGYLVSVRAPLANKVNADTLCRRFPTGGGRPAAAGINQLPEELFNEFLEAFTDTYR
nr:acetyltransferase [Gammaproteobacteria bacterium]